MLAGDTVVENRPTDSQCADRFDALPIDGFRGESANVSSRDADGTGHSDETAAPTDTR